jgi:hypothetical protein
MKVLPVGTELTCPKCHHIMVRSIHEITTGMVLKAEYFESVDGSTKGLMVCLFDGVPYAISGKVHTKDGWL